MFKNVASQTWTVFAFDLTDNTPKTGDAANITSKIKIDTASAAATNDTNPTEIEDGYYEFTLTQSESNGDKLTILPESSTSNIQVIGVPGVIYTRPVNFPELGIESDGDLTKVNTLDGHTPQTGDSYPTVNTNIDAAVSTRSSHSAADVWTSATRTLTSFGTLISDIWSNVTRTLTAGTKDSEIDTINANTLITKKVSINRWKIDTTANTLIYYDDDGTTPIYTFDLKNAAGNPASGDASQTLYSFERDPQ